mgnify:CR=1 FL=1|jgi:hypothetical protein
MALNNLVIIPECYVDTCLIETIIDTGHCNHQKGCNKVSSTMQTKYRDQFVIGVIDKDKRQIPYLNEFDLIGSKASVLLHKHRVQPHYIIQVSPAVEAFIIQSVEEINIRLTDYELPEERRKFIRTTKQITSKKDKKLKQLITDLKDTAGIKLLTDLLKYLLANRYDSDIDILQSMLNE